LLTDYDIELFRAGKHFRLYEKMGSHLVERDGEAGVYFAVYAPAAQKVQVIADINHWTGAGCDLYVRWDGSGIWEGFIPGMNKGDLYKYRIESNHYGQVLEKADPFARFAELRPKTASIVWEDKYKWGDKKWMNSREQKNNLQAPISIYEIHTGSWMWNVEENRPLNYRELADALVKYVSDMNFTHVEFMPIMEHPYDPSWGYQITGYYAPTSRFGTPEDFKYLVDRFHKKGIGVILDWVPSHFPEDPHGLGYFDGSCVYEHPDRRKGFHPDWKSLIFNYERAEVRSFLISNALFWLDQYHADGLRVDAVASMLFLDYSREDGDWEPNHLGGRENLDAIQFMKDLNEATYTNYPGTMTIAEESTAFPMVSRPVFMGGLGFGMKWMMGWMHDTLEYFKKDPIYRSYHHNEISFSLTYAFTENFVLPLSHDEVVHGKGSILSRMPGDEWQRFANLRLLYTYMYTHPGAKLLFMGNEIGQSEEWDYAGSLDWHLLDYTYHAGIQSLIRDLNGLYRRREELHRDNYSADGFEWIDHTDSQNNLIAYLRKCKETQTQILVVCHFSPAVRRDYKLGVPGKPGEEWKLILNSDESYYGGSDFDVKAVERSIQGEQHGRKQHLNLILPPLAALVFRLKKS
jgi:1,4-alpha-glucan branching enzyme